MFEIDSAAMSIASQFTVKNADNDTEYVHFEKMPGKSILMTALDGYALISFLLLDANPEEVRFTRFSLRIKDDVIKLIKPKKDHSIKLKLYVDSEAIAKGSSSYAKLVVGDTSVDVYATQGVIDLASFWKRAEESLKTQTRDDSLCANVSIIPFRGLLKFDFSKFFSHLMTPAFVKADTMTIVVQEGLPENIIARGLVMQEKASFCWADFKECYGDPIVSWRDRAEC